MTRLQEALHGGGIFRDSYKFVTRETDLTGQGRRGNRKFRVVSTT